MWNRCKTCEIANIENFSTEYLYYYASHIYSCSIKVSGLYGEKSFEKGVKKRCEIANIEEFSIVKPYEPYLFL